MNHKEKLRTQEIGEGLLLLLRGRGRVVFTIERRATQVWGLESHAPGPQRSDVRAIFSNAMKPP